MTTDIRRAASKLAMDDVRSGWLKPKSIVQSRKFRLARYLTGKPYWLHSIECDGVHITEYWSTDKHHLVEASVIEILAGGKNAGHKKGTRGFEQLRLHVEQWALKAFDHRNFEAYGMTVGSLVEVRDTNYFGGQKLMGEVTEVDPEDDDFNVWVKFPGFPYLVFNHSELKVRQLPVKVPMSLALPATV
ncbi:hypothetical protein AUR04nite_00750 [Glutamicibacter uratoxydans]|uniref:Uncharacterized protein n=1 Tax=Glutamicibacter uratoxydans TaxID=43667 RepID=A0A4Y4DJ20_GLUUR|nr:hypothetical protein [Glutamicibacter uratoxydans]GED04543.1 hypothetical protein AUR04nite_00750 [Glutamicibacter uratoxydans]